MYQPAPPDLEQRLFKLQAQLDRLSLALHQWQQAQEHLQPMELRLSQLMQQSSELLDRLSTTDERHAKAVGEVETRLTEWGGFEHRLAQDWQALRQQLSQDLQSVIAEVRAQGTARPAALTTGASGAWPIEGVLRLHEELRADDGGAQSPAIAGTAAPQIPALAESLAGRVDSLERAVSAEKDELTEATTRGDRQRRTWYIAFAVLAGGIVLAAVLILGIGRRLDARLNEADARVADAKRQADTAAALANQKVAATQEDARRQIDEARQTAQKAQVVSEVLAAPDLVRFTLSGRTDEARANSHLLWSRSRGLVFSGLRLPPVPAKHTYQLWLLTNGEPVSAGLFVPDAAGMATVIVPEAPRVPRPVIGASVTVEPFGGSPAPSDPPVVAHLPRVADPSSR